MDVDATLSSTNFIMVVEEHKDSVRKRGRKGFDFEENGPTALCIKFPLEGVLNFENKPKTRLCCASYLEDCDVAAIG